MSEKEIRAFTRLLNGIAYAYYHNDELPDVEHIVVKATFRAFTKTLACSEACHKFGRSKGGKG